jgi:hypothetical protein
MLLIVWIASRLSDALHLDEHGASCGQQIAPGMEE